MSVYMVHVFPYCSYYMYLQWVKVTFYLVGISTFIIVTAIESLHVGRDIFYDENIAQLLHAVSVDLGVPHNHIFPIVKETLYLGLTDILTLMPLDMAVTSIDIRYENVEDPNCEMQN